MTTDCSETNGKDMDDLLETLKDQAEMLRELIHSAEQQQDALAHLRGNELEKITEYQTQLLLLMQQKERLRRYVMSSQLSIPEQEAGRMTLSEMLEHMKEYERDAYRVMQTELQALAARLQQINNTNRVLANRARVSAQTTIKILQENVTICNVTV